MIIIKQRQEENGKKTGKEIEKAKKKMSSGVTRI
jgi:hypothetical protein